MSGCCVCLGAGIQVSCNTTVEYSRLGLPVSECRGFGTVGCEGLNRDGGPNSLIRPCCLNASDEAQCRESESSERLHFDSNNECVRVVWGERRWGGNRSDAGKENGIDCTTNV